MHCHPREEEAIFVLQGTANMSIAGEEVVVPAGAIVKFPANVPHDVRNLGAERCVIMFLKVNPKVLKAGRRDGRVGRMGNVERCDKTLPTNEMMFHVRKRRRAARPLAHRPRGARPRVRPEPGRVRGVRDKDPRRMMDLGVHQYYVPQILRLFFGAAHNSNASAALECYRRAYPEETAQAMALQERLERAQ